jgi:hypothetical protein
MHDSDAPSPRLRRVLAAIFLFGSVGTGAELVLLEHVEGAWQLTPLVLIGVGFAVLGLLELSPSSPGLRLFQLTMLAFMLSGVVGVWLHYQGNVEFERELDPEGGGMGLFWAAMKGATPALAPGTMALLGAIGFTYAHRHPAVKAR